MTFAEKLSRMNADDAVEIGDIVDRTLKGQFGELFLAVIDQLKSMELQNSRTARSESSDKVLGRLEAYETVVANFEGYVKQALELREPIEVEDEFANELAIEQKEPLRGGAV